MDGESAGAHLAHYKVMKHGPEKLPGKNVTGTVLVHTCFGGVGNEVSESEEARKRFAAFWHFVCPTTSGCDDPLRNPIFYPKLASLGGTLVTVHYETLKESAWGTVVIEIMEARGEGHAFHSLKPSTMEKSENETNRPLNKWFIIAISKIMLRM
ncbi:hypothetical protein NC653_004223 [Populus alba x Populus x berolinensis]|uniref:Alpha/beta hydrolase fold-3 domain-containing protein n=1 Tax=Populus alba x Populus x berolinensis TaxID=444605 RepID=A0AAD6WK85_9ROSI|nr:hypothetical protein NC653_004223 [Populus alba x Populus x berolinensis]